MRIQALMNSSAKLQWAAKWHYAGWGTTKITRAGKSGNEKDSVIALHTGNIIKEMSI
jgi:hypothetical protein